MAQTPTGQGTTPAGATLDPGNGLYWEGGLSYAGAPVTPTPTSTAPVTAPASTAPIPPTGTPVPVTQTGGNVAPSTGSLSVTQPESEGDLFTKYYDQSQGLIDSIQGAYDAEVSTAETAGSEQEAGQAAADAAAGLMGSSASAANAGNIQNLTSAQIATINSNRATAIAGVVNNLQDAATTQANTEYENASDANAAALKNTSAAISGLITNGVTFSMLSTNPAFASTYQALLQNYGGDANSLAAAYTMATPPQNVVNSWAASDGTYYEVLQDPVTKAITQQSFKLPVTPPTAWTSTKVSTTTVMFQDPNNPGNTLIYTTDPLTGNVQVTGTGTGSALASSYNTAESGTPGGSSTPGSTTTTPSTSTTTAGSNYINTVASVSGVSDPTASFTTAVNGDGTTPGVGIGPIVSGVIQAEGGSPSGVVNNPGNVKYIAGMTGATDSGVKASDGGTFASFDTPANGKAAIASSLNSIAQNQGASATLGSVLTAYGNLGTTQSAAATAEYGLLGAPTTQSALQTAGAPAFNPNAGGSQGAIDTAALSYLQNWLSGTQPTTTNTTGMRSSSNAVFLDVTQRAKQLYTAATGQELPNMTTLTGQLTNLGTNNTLLNTINTQTGVIAKNFGLSIANMTANNINSGPPAINGTLDALAQLAGSTSTAQYLEQNSTLTNEIGTLLSLKNASGTTVADKLAASEQVPSDLSLDQQKSILAIVQKEALNQQISLANASLQLYGQTDPLNINPANPMSNPNYSALSGAGFTWIGNKDYLSPDGTSIYTVDNEGNVTPVAPDSQ